MTIVKVKKKRRRPVFVWTIGDNLYYTDYK